MAIEAIGPYSLNRRAPTSREINQAIELLRDAGADDQALRLLDIWNAHRLVERAQTVGTHEELSNLFAGLRPNARHQSGHM